MPRPKSHLYITPVPLVGSPLSLTVQCGKSVPNATAIYAGEDAQSVAVTCSKCQIAIVEPSQQMTWHYAVVNAQSALIGE